MTASPANEPPTNEQPTNEQSDVARWVDVARVALERLEVDQSDAVARGMLGEAWEALGAQCPEEIRTGYDRLLAPGAPALPIRTERLTLRFLTESDIGDLFGIYRSPENVRYLLTEPHDEARSAARIVEVRQPISTPERYRLVLGVEYRGRLVGELTCILTPPSWSMAEVGWILHPEFTGQGLATEAARALVDLAFSHFGVHRVFANLDPRNVRSAALCTRLGMTLEASMRRDCWSKGEWTDSSMYSLLRNEWAG